MTKKEDGKFRDSGQLRADLSYRNERHMKANDTLARERALFGVLLTIGHALINIGDELYDIKERIGPMP